MVADAFPLFFFAENVQLPFRGNMSFNVSFHSKTAMRMNMQFDIAIIMNMKRYVKIYFCVKKYKYYDGDFEIVYIVFRGWESKLAEILDKNR
jgi:hypothetical protein